jgi:hypothetical protein
MTCARPNFRPKRSTIHMQELRCDMQETEEIEVRRDMKAAIETSLPHQLFPRLAPATAESATSCSSLCAPRRRKGTSHGGQSLFIRVFVLFSPPTLLSQRGAAMLSFLSTRIGLNPSNRMADGNDRPAPAAVAHSPGGRAGRAGIERRTPRPPPDFTYPRWWGELEPKAQPPAPTSPDGGRSCSGSEHCVRTVQ